MQVSAFICGLIGGLISLLVGMFGSVMFSLASAGGSSMAGLYQFASYALPLVAIVGAGLTFKNALYGGLLMLASAIGTLLLFGFGGFSILPIALIGVGGVLGVIADRQAQAASSTPRI